jgi:hypothetical protein
MTTRFDAKDDVNYGVQGVKSGYDGLRGDLTIPSCGVEDVDFSLFNLFDKEIQPSCSGQDSADIKKVPIIFAAGEKWALLKRGKPIRDRNNTLILPLITIVRTQISQESSDITGRGINQQTGELVIRRRLDPSDRNYQNIINRLYLENQQNLAVNPNFTLNDVQFTSNRKVGELRNNAFVKSGALLQSNRKNNIFETLLVPAPQFYTAKYEITVWTQYMQHMNQIVEKIMSSMLPQATSWKLTTPKGYWFVAKLMDGSLNTETNFDDMSTEERFIKTKFEVNVPAYLWASSAPGVPIPIKRYVSSPIIKFEITSNQRNAADGTAPEEFQNNFLLGQDDPTLPLDEQANVRDDQRQPGWRQQKVQPINTDGTIDQNDPALLGYPRGFNPSKYRKIDLGNGQVKYVKIIKVNSATGETVYTAAELEGLSVNPVD